MFVYERPKTIRGYKKQVEFIDAPERYTIVEATTKAGKTVGCIVWLFEQALKGTEGSNCWWVAPINAQAKIAFRRLCRYISNKEIYEANKTELTITLFNGCTIFFKSADNADSLYGDDVVAVVIDEATRMQEDAWWAIRSTLTKTEGRVKIIGNVKGTGNWVYQLARKAEQNQLPDWKYFRITADDAIAAGILKQKEIDDAKSILPNGVFLELYYGIPNQNSSNKFCFAFEETKHVKKCEVNLEQIVYLSFDFNKNPICCSVIQHYDGIIKVCHCLKLANSDIYKLCERIRNMFPDSTFLITGDASGKNLNAMVRDNLNYYKIIMKELNVSINQMHVPTINPKLEDNQVLVNGVLEHYNIEIDPDNASALVFDCKFVEMNPDGGIKKGDRDDPMQQADALDTFRYWLNIFMPNFKK